MHDGEVDIDVRLVEQLVAGQFPHLADLPIDPVTSTATVNAVFRLGDRLCVRLPRVAAWSRDLHREWRWLPELAPQLSLRIPEPVELGRPASSYPFSWAIYRWIDGAPYADESVDDETLAARDLARFVLELRRIDPVADAPAAGRTPLAEADAATRAALDSARGVIDSDAATADRPSADRPRWD